LLDEVGGEGGQAIGLSFAVPELEPNVPIIRPPALLKRRPECIHASLRLRVSLDIRQEQTQSAHSVRRRRFGSDRRKNETASENDCESAENREELASLHSITWSARKRMDCGIERPRAFAVLRLITSSNLVGCSTGRSPGFAPLRILSMYLAARRNKSG
jgi:hypothetical protein